MGLPQRVRFPQRPVSASQGALIQIMNDELYEQASEPVTLEVETTRFGYLLLCLAVDDFEPRWPLIEGKMHLKSLVENSADATTQALSNNLLSSLSHVSEPREVPPVVQEEDGDGN